MSVITLLLWLYCALGTFYKSVWRGQLFFAPGLEGWSEQQALEQWRGKGKPSDEDEPEKNGGPVVADVPATGRQVNGSNVDEYDDHRLDGTFRRSKTRSSNVGDDNA